MESIKITVVGNQATAEYTQPLVAGTVGQPVEFSFDTVWQNLTKTAVFRVGDTVMDCLDVANATVPWELLNKPGCTLYVGVYGTNADGSLQIPTVWAQVGVIQPGADPSGDESADPTLPVWQQALSGTVLTDPQELTEEQQTQARENIGAAAANPLSDKYDLKEGYSYTEGVYIAADGTETAATEDNYKCIDYIPVKAGRSYTMYGVGYALYDTDKVFLSAVIEDGGVNRMREFTPAVNGYVRLTINSYNIEYARFCLTAEKTLDQNDYDYYPAPSPFINPRLACDVHLYGDSNSEGYGLEDASKAWSNRLGSLITRMPGEFVHRRWNMFAATPPADDVYQGIYGILGSTGYASLTAYANSFSLVLVRVGEILVKIDGQQVESITGDPSSTTPFSHTITVEEGLHTLELWGVSGNNDLAQITTSKSRAFTNHAVYGTVSSSLPKTPEGSIAIVMYGTNDRMYIHGATRHNIGTFYTACKKAGVVPFIFTPIPTAISREENAYYKQNISDVIAQLPNDCVNVYTDLQIIELLGGRTIFSDGLHLNEYGHKMLYALAASKLRLAALTSELIDEEA